MPKVATVDLNFVRDLSGEELEKLIVRFEKYTVTTDTGCIIWTGKSHSNAHGRMTVQGKSYYAHRVAYVMFKGPLPIDKVVCHSCDNPQCVNVEHLFLGSIRDNSIDLAKKGLNGTVLHPEAYANRRFGPKITDEIKMAALNAYLDTNLSQREIAAKYGISKSMVNKIIIEYSED